jgi:hypothetical protein
MNGCMKAKMDSDYNTHAKNQIVTVCQNIVDSLDERAKTGTTITDFSKAFNIVLYD